MLERSEGHNWKQQGQTNSWNTITDKLDSHEQTSVCLIFLYVTLYIMQKFILIVIITEVVSRLGMSGGGNKVSKFMMSTQLRKVNCRESSLYLSSIGSVSTEQK